ncbi:MAG: FAD-binding protein, partial [Gemmiger formicilis]
MRYDIAIVGSGPAGLAASINAKVRNKNIIIFGSNNASVKITKAPSIENYLGFEEISGVQLKDKFMSHVKSMGVEIT